MGVKRTIGFILFMLFFIQVQGIRAEESSCTRHIRLTKGESYILKLDGKRRKIKKRPIIKINNPEIADIELLDLKHILINGKKFGTTTLTIDIYKDSTSIYYISVMQKIEWIKGNSKKTERGEKRIPCE